MNPNQGSEEMNLVEMRTRIVEAASPLLESQGKGASVEDIAKAAGMSVPVTYQFVKKPADIMLLIMENLQHMFLAGLKEEMDESLPIEDKIAIAMRQYYQVVDNQAHKVVLVYRGSRALDKAGRRRIMELETEIKDVYRNLLDQGVAAGDFRAIDTDLVAYDIMVMGHLWALKSWHFNKRGMKLDEFIKAQFENLLAMIKP